MKRGTKLAAMFAATIMSAAALAGCSTSGGDDVSKLSVWLPPFGSDEPGKGDLELWQSILDPFEEEHDVTVDVTIVPWESFEERFLTGFSSGDGPDIGYMYTEMIGDYISRGQLSSFEEYITDEDREKYFFLEQGEYEGEQFGIPIVVGGARVLYSNMDLLKAAGVSDAPTNWDEFVAAAAKVQKTGVSPLEMAWGEPGVGILAPNYINFLWQAGGEIVNEDGTAAAFNDEAGLRAAQFVLDLKEKHGFLSDTTTGMNADDMRAKFSAGETAFVFGEDAYAAEFEEAGVNIDATVLSDETAAAFVATDVLVMSKTAKDPELAAALARFMTSGPSMDKFATIAAYPPISTEQTTTTNPLFSDLYSVDADQLRSYPAVANSATLYTSLYENLQQMLLGQKTAEQALADAETAANAALSQNAK